MNNVETPPSPDNIKMAKFIANAIGFEPHVYPYFDDKNENKISILNLTDPIDSKVAIYCTIGLSDYQNPVEMNDGNKKNIPIELLIASHKVFDKTANILSTCAFYIMKDEFECRPGGVFKKIIEFLELGITAALID